MKKIFGYLLLSASLLSLGVVNKTNKDFQETTLLDNDNYVTLNHVRKASENNGLSYSKMFSQVAYDEVSESYFLRFATAVKGDINTINYSRKVEGKDDKEVSSSVVYYGISANGETLYYDEATQNASSDVSLKGNYYWTCYTIKFNKGSEFINKNISLTLKVNDVEIASKTTSVTDNFNKLTIEAESDYVERMTADGKALNTETYNGVTFVKDLSGDGSNNTQDYGNAYLKFAFISSIAGEASLNATLRQMPWVFELKKYVSIEINGVNYEHNKNLPADTNANDKTPHNEWAFMNLDLGTINIKKGYNTIKFIVNDGDGLYSACPDFDKITLISVASMEEYTHKCLSVCPICGKCQNLTCDDEVVCKDKCDCTTTVVEVESDSVERKKADGGSLTLSTDENGNTFTKDVYNLGNAYIMFNLEANAKGKALLKATFRMMPWDFPLHQYVEININGVTYEYNKMLPKDQNESHDAPYKCDFVTIELGIIELEQGINTIKFISKDCANPQFPDFDKIELLGQTIIQEVK